MKTVQMMMITAVLLITVSGCIAINSEPCMIDGKLIETPEAAGNYMSETTIKQLAEVSSGQHYGGRLLIALPSDQALQAPPFLTKPEAGTFLVAMQGIVLLQSPPLLIAVRGTLSEKNKIYVLCFYKADFKAIADGLRKSNMFNSVMLENCPDLTAYARQNGYDYTLEHTGRNYILTDIKSGKSVDAGIAQGLKYSIKNIAWAMRELVVEAAPPATTGSNDLNRADHSKPRKDKDSTGKINSERDIYF
ncbi:MAG: hypothetical protein WCI51_09225 [Lentisphaerota bacterium]